MGPTGKHSDTADNQICGYDEDWENPEECANVVLLVLAAAIEVVLLLGLVQRNAPLLGDQLEPDIHDTLKSVRACLRNATPRFVQTAPGGAEGQVFHLPVCRARRS